MTRSHVRYETLVKLTNYINSTEVDEEGMMQIILSDPNFSTASREQANEFLIHLLFQLLKPEV